MKRDYLSRLTLWARWYLPEKEAAEVVEDYRELVGHEPRSEEELRRDVGTPKDAVGLLVQVKAYQRWLAVFCVLTVCVAAPMVMARHQVYWNPLIDPAFIIASCLGTGLSLLWFQQNGVRRGPMPKTAAVLLVLILLGMAWVWFFAGLVLTESWTLLNSIAASVIAPRSLHFALTAESFAMGLVCVFGLIKARLGDRRWRAVYVLGLSCVLLVLSFWLLLSSMNLDGFTPGWQIPLLLRYGFITMVGLLGTAVSLC